MGTNEIYKHSSFSVKNFDDTMQLSADNPQNIKLLWKLFQRGRQNPIYKLVFNPLSFTLNVLMN